MMKKLVVSLGMLSALSSAYAQPNADGLLYDLGEVTTSAWYQDEAQVWQLSEAVFEMGKAKCLDDLEKLSKAGVPGSAKVMLGRDTYGLTAGEHTVDEVTPICQRTVKYGKIKSWEKWAIEAMRDNARVTNGQRIVTTYMENCLSTYDTMIKAGISPNDNVLETTVNDNDGKPVRWAGTVGELRKKWCETGLAKANEKLDEKDAPFKKVLKADKLRDALLYRSFWLVGGGTTDDPKVMAKANVLFTDSSPQEYCVGNGAQVHVLTRLQYNGAHKLLKATTSRHCGNPPAKAYK